MSATSVPVPPQGQPSAKPQSSGKTLDTQSTEISTTPRSQSSGQNKVSSTPDKRPSRYVIILPGPSITLVAHLVRSDMFRDVVTLVVGDNKKIYVLHKDLLCFYSDYFRAAFNGSFVEAIKRRVELPEVEEKTFEYFQLWLYTRKLDFVSMSFSDTTKLWIFGDQHQVPLLQNEAIDGLFAKRIIHRAFSVKVVPLAYQNTFAGSPLRRAVIEIASSVAIQDSPHSITKAIYEHLWSVESLIDLVRAVDSRDKDLQQYSLPKRGRCFFHVHGKDEQCPK
ncbi:hypothetical protein D6D03_07347 [Aureobasidium pullulans]|nr:hypothetical protein D6D03_07347 [Aureobasidium pullulans]